MSTNGSCPVCRVAVKWVPRLTLEDVDGDESFDVVECPSCTVLRTLPVPDDLARYYGAEIGRMMTARESRLHTIARRVLLEREARRILPHVNPTAVLDIGAGPGDFAALIHGKGIRTMTVDAQPEPPVCTRNIRGLAHYQIEFDSGDIAGLDSTPGRLALLRHVLEHVKDPREFLLRLVGHGVTHFYIVVPNAGCLERRLFGRSWYLWDPPRHLWHFTLAALDRLFRELDFEVIVRGRDTVPNITPSLYRLLRVRGWPPVVTNRFRPKGALAALSAPINLLIPGNVLWMLVRSRPSAPGSS